MNLNRHDVKKIVFVFLGKDKLGVSASESVRVVLECDGTQVEDGEYFRTLANNTVLLLLRQGERWYPTGVDVIKAGKSLHLAFRFKDAFTKVTLEYTKKGRTQ